jgi:hypothetical protein
MFQGFVVYGSSVNFRHGADYTTLAQVVYKNVVYPTDLSVTVGV